MKRVLKNWLSMGCALVALVTTTASHADKFYYVHNDHLGTPQVITDEHKNVVWEVDRDPWGNITHVIVDNLPNNVSLPGMYADAETGYSDNGWRPYDAKTGQYLQSDPIGLAGGINTFAYANGNPVMNVDPLGLFVPSDKTPAGVELMEVLAPKIKPPPSTPIPPVTPPVPPSNGGDDDGGNNKQECISKCMEAYRAEVTICFFTNTPNSEAHGQCVKRATKQMQDCIESCRKCNE